MAEIEGLPRWQWRRGGDGAPQRRVTVRLDVDYTSPDNQDPAKLAAKLLEFSARHEDATAESEHKYETHPDYSCEHWLELRGWETVTEADVERALESRRRERRTEQLAEKRRLEEQLAQAKRRLGEL